MDMSLMPDPTFYPSPRMAMKAAPERIAYSLLNVGKNGNREGFDRKSMTSLQEFRCEVCGTVTSNPIHWFVIQCGDAELTVLKWTADGANAAGARHFCGEAHAQVYISRWFESVCSPPKPDFTRPVAAK